MPSRFRLSDFEFDALFSEFGPFSSDPSAHTPPRGFFDIDSRAKMPLSFLAFANILDDTRLTRDMADLAITTGFERGSPDERQTLASAFITARFLPPSRPLRAFRITRLRLANLYDWCTPQELTPALASVFHRASHDNPFTLTNATELAGIDRNLAADAIAALLSGAPDSTVDNLAASCLIKPNAVKALIGLGRPFSLLASLVEVPDRLFGAYLAQLNPALRADAEFLWRQVQTPERYAAVLAALAPGDQLLKDTAWLFSRYLSDAEITATLPHCSPLLLKRYLNVQERFSLAWPSREHVIQAAALLGPENTAPGIWFFARELPNWYVARLFLHLPGLARVTYTQSPTSVKIIARLVDLDNPYVATLLDQPSATLADLRRATSALVTV